MRTIIYIMMAIAIIEAYSCQSKSIPSKSYPYQTIDSRGNKLLLGKGSRENLQAPPFDVWFNKNYADYKIDSNTCNLLKSKLASYQISIFMGTWCGDSRREVPRMFKILDFCKVNPSHIKLFLLGSIDSLYKQSPGHEERGLEIHRVPDFILFKNKKEIGRIVEEPVVSLEKDLLSIINGEGYTPHFKAVSVLADLLAQHPFPYTDAQLIEFANIVKHYCKSAGELNTYGYVKMSAGEMGKAEAAFKINLLLYPKEGNVYDSMGDFYIINGQPKMAKDYYQKRLELEPGNEATRKKWMLLQNK